MNLSKPLSDGVEGQVNKHTKNGRDGYKLINRDPLSNHISGQNKLNFSSHEYSGYDSFVYY